MNLNKSIEFFNPKQVQEPIHIIGCGAIGSTIAENLARLGINTMHLWDFDIVEAHNIANQMFYADQIKKPKTVALAEILTAINPEIKLILHEAWQPEEMMLTGFVFMCVDKISVRKQILENIQFNDKIIAIFDSRMRLTDAQHYASSWQTPSQKEFLIKTMDFTDEEAAEQTPVSACGTTLSVNYTVRVIAALAVNNFVHKVNNNALYKTILLDLASPNIDAFLE